MIQKGEEKIFRIDLLQFKEETVGFNDFYFMEIYSDEKGNIEKQELLLKFMNYYLLQIIKYRQIPEQFFIKIDAPYWKKSQFVMKKINIPEKKSHTC